MIDKWSSSLKAVPNDTYRFSPKIVKTIGHRLPDVLLAGICGERDTPNRRRVGRLHLLERNQHFNARSTVQIHVDERNQRACLLCLCDRRLYRVRKNDRELRSIF